MNSLFWVVVLVQAVGVVIAVKVLATLKDIKSDVDEIKTKAKGIIR